MVARNRFAFTLVELVVVIIIMTMLAGLSAIAYRSLATDMKMSAAMNTISSALDNARALAIKKNRYVMTAFTPRLEDDGSSQLIDIVVAEWSGDSANEVTVVYGNQKVWTYDRFVPVSNLEVRTIDGGINVAGPGYAKGNDDLWWVCTFLPNVREAGPIIVGNNEPFGPIIGVLYSPEGRVVTRNAESGADRIWIDFNQDGVQTISDDETIQWPWPNQVLDSDQYFDLEVQGGEPFISITSILAVFDETALREESREVQTTFTECFHQECCGITHNTSDYDGRQLCRFFEYTLYIRKYSDRIQFNRYSGVPLE